MIRSTSANVCCPHIFVTAYVLPPFLSNSSSFVKNRLASDFELASSRSVFRTVFSSWCPETINQLPPGYIQGAPPLCPRPLESPEMRADAWEAIHGLDHRWSVDTWSGRGSVLGIPSIVPGEALERGKRRAETCRRSPAGSTPARQRRSPPAGTACCMADGNGCREAYTGGGEASQLAPKYSRRRRVQCCWTGGSTGSAASGEAPRVGRGLDKAQSRGRGCQGTWEVLLRPAQ